MKAKIISILLVIIAANLNAQTWSGTTPGNIYYNQGNVGIGTSSPSFMLHLKDPSGGAALGLERNGKLWRFDVDYTGAQILYIGHTDKNYIFNLTSSGNVGIGTINPDYKLTVNGGLRSYSSVSGDDIEAFTSRIQSSQIEGIRVNSSSTNTSKAVFGIVGFATSSYSLPGTATATGVYGYATSPSGSYAGFFNGNLGYSGSFGNPSDKRLKENISDLPNSLDLILSLKPVQFRYKKIKGINFPDGERAGFIAQDVEALIPSLVNHNGIPLTDSVDYSAIEKPNEYLTVDYIGLIPYIIKSIQDQQLVINKQNLLIESLLVKDSVNSISNLTSKQIPHIKSLFPNPA